MAGVREDAEAVVRRLRERGHMAVFAGGCVRDLLRGVEPEDYDIATSALPAEVRDLFPKSQAVGAHFGVVIVRSGRHHFEVATFREDKEYRDGRRPEGVNGLRAIPSQARIAANRATGENLVTQTRAIRFTTSRVRIAARFKSGLERPFPPIGTPVA